MGPAYPADVTERGWGGAGPGREALEKESRVLLRLPPLAQQAQVHAQQLPARLCNGTVI